MPPPPKPFLQRKTSAGFPDRNPGTGASHNAPASRARIRAGNAGRNHPGSGAGGGKPAAWGIAESPAPESRPGLSGPPAGPVPAYFFFSSTSTFRRSRVLPSAWASAVSASW